MIGTFNVENIVLDYGLSVGIFLFMHALAIFAEPTIFTSIHSKGNFSDKSTNFVVFSLLINFSF